MLNGTTSDAEQQLSDVAQRFRRWRAVRRHRSEPIPVALWDEAVALCAMLPIGRVVHTLRLSGGELKKRCQAQSATPGTEFIELPAPVTPTSSPPAGVVVELHRPDGARLSIRSASGTLPLGELLGTFLAQH